MEKIRVLKNNFSKWMPDYLNDRQMSRYKRSRFRVDQDNKWSTTRFNTDPVMILIYVNDMEEGVDIETSLLADDAKVIRRLNEVQNCRKLQEDIVKSYN